MILDAEIYCISERHVQLHTVNLPPACYKFMLLNCRDCFLFVVFTRHGEKVIVERKNCLLKFCALSGQCWVENEFAGVKDCKQEGEFCAVEQKKEGIWDLRLEEGERWIYYTHP